MKILTWKRSVPMRDTGDNFPSNSANNGTVSEALFEHFKLNSTMNPIWLTMVASCVVNDVDSIVGFVQVRANDAENKATNALINNNFDIFLSF